MQFGDERAHKNQGPYRELPLSVSRQATTMPMYGRLPLEAEVRGWELMMVEEPRGGRDPAVLYDASGSILQEWPENYEPGWAEVFEVCHRLLGL